LLSSLRNKNKSGTRIIIIINQILRRIKKQMTKIMIRTQMELNMSKRLERKRRKNKSLFRG